MKKSSKVLIIIAIFLLIFVGVLSYLIYQYYFCKPEVDVDFGTRVTANGRDLDEIDLNDNMAETIRLLVVDVTEYSIETAEIGKDNSISSGSELSVPFSKEGNIGFKRGQEVLVYFNGVINATFPGSISNPGKIEIIKEESDIEIPKSVLKSFCSSTNNVNVEVKEITTKGISLTIEDNNEIKYDYGNTYALDKQIKNPEYTGVGYKIGEDTENSRAAYSRNRFGILLSRVK